MKKTALVLLSICAFLLASCSKPEKKDTSSTSDPTSSSTTTPSEAVAQPLITAQEVAQRFEEAQLNVIEKRDMGAEDYGLAPMKAASGVIFGVYYSEYTASYLNARVTAYTNLTDLQEVKNFYDNLSNEDPAYKSWTVANESKLVLLQMNGEMDETFFQSYVSVLNTL